MGAGRWGIQSCTRAPSEHKMTAHWRAQDVLRDCRGPFAAPQASWETRHSIQATMRMPPGLSSTAALGTKALLSEALETLLEIRWHLQTSGCVTEILPNTSHLTLWPCHQKRPASLPHTLGTLLLPTPHRLPVLSLLPQVSPLCEMMGMWEGDRSQCVPPPKPASL